MVLWLDAKVLEDAVAPEALHVVPVLNLSMPHRIVDAITGSIGSRKSLVADEKVEILGPPLPRKIAATASSTGQV